MVNINKNLVNSNLLKVDVKTDKKPVQAKETEVKEVAQNIKPTVTSISSDLTAGKISASEAVVQLTALGAKAEVKAAGNKTTIICTLAGKQYTLNAPNTMANIDTRVPWPPIHF